MRMNRSEVFCHGLFVGFIGYLTVFLAVGVGDLLRGNSFFHTFALLGGWTFYGLEDPAAVRVWAGPVFAYNGLHLLIFLAFGVFTSFMAKLAERGPLLWYGALIMYLFVFGHLYSAVLLMTEPMRSAFSVWHMSIPSVLSLGLMSFIVLRQHPQLRHELEQWVDDTDADEAPAEELLAVSDMQHPLVNVRR